MLPADLIRESASLQITTICSRLIPIEQYIIVPNYIRRRVLPVLKITRTTGCKAFTAVSSLVLTYTGPKMVMCFLVNVEESLNSKAKEGTEGKRNVSES